MSSGPDDPRYPSSLAQPVTGRPALIPPAPPHEAVRPAAAPRRGLRGTAWLWALAATVLSIVLVTLVGYFLDALGAGASIIGLVLALVPFGIVLVGVRMIDRWEPEPLRFLLFAIAWGAIVSVGVALLVDLLLSRVLGPRRGELAETLTALVQAPVVEEVAKGAGVLLICLLARRVFDGPVDGVVYGALVGAGFAFTENIQYFGISFLEGGVGDVSATFFVRGILSPFAHAMFTAVIGFALGLAARRGRTGAGLLGPWAAGLLGGIALHAFWNGSALLADFYALYLTLQVPLFLLFIAGIVALRREEARLTRMRLGEYAAAGWFTAEEVDMLATGRGRRRAMAWARTFEVDRSPVMKGFIAEATALAFARQRALSGRDDHAAERERELLARTQLTRARLLSR